MVFFKNIRLIKKTHFSYNNCKQADTFALILFTMQEASHDNGF